MRDVLPDLHGSGGVVEARPVLPVSRDGELIGGGDTTLNVATREGRGYLAYTRLQEITLGKILALRIHNPPDAERRLCIFNRIFENTVKANSNPLEYVAFAAPEPFENTAPIAQLNTFKQGDPEFDSGAQASWGFLTAAELPAALGTTGALPTAGSPREFDFDYWMKPGSTVTFGIFAPLRLTPVRAKAAIAVQFYTESIT